MEKKKNESRKYALEGLLTVFSNPDWTRLHGQTVAGTMNHEPFPFPNFRTQLFFFSFYFLESGSQIGCQKISFLWRNIVYFEELGYKVALNYV